MGVPRRLRKKKAYQRKQRAIAAQKQLEKILIAPFEHNDLLISSATRDVWRIGTRHQLGIPSGLKHWICRNCHSLLRPGISARVRIHKRTRVITCDCGKVRRYNLRGKINE